MKHKQLELPNSTISYIKYLTEEIHRVVNVQCGAITHTYKHAHEERERERERPESIFFSEQIATCFQEVPAPIA
jgi:hypothetical protein